MSDDTLAYTIPFQLTKKIQRKLYDELSPTRPELSAMGKIIVITGGGTGIGAAAALVWAQAGAEGIVLAARRQDKLDATAENLRAQYTGTKFLTVSTDVGDDGQVENLFKKIVSTFGRHPDVVLSNAGVVALGAPHDLDSEDWWNVHVVNLKSTYTVARHFVRSQPNPAEPTGTFVTVNSGLGGMIVPGFSAYNIAKLSAQRFVEFLNIEYPTLRSFTLYPGIVATDILDSNFVKYALDQAELTGALTLYLSTTRADFLKGGLASINWDVTELEASKDRIIKEDLTKIKWMPILPASGGKGL